jgi:hypothetical protein
MGTIEHYRERAGHFRRLAEAESSLREQFAELARQYDQLAEAIEGTTPKAVAADPGAARHG